MSDDKYEKMPLNLKWGEHQRNGETHEEYYFPCDCGLHLIDYPHIHPCSPEHDRNIGLQQLKEAEEERDEDFAEQVKIVDKMREALEYYADDSHWFGHTFVGKTKEGVYQYDKNKIAKEALPEEIKQLSK